MEQRTFIRHLRNNPTPAERKLWRHLSVRQLAGVRFNRQVRVGGYAIDLALRTARLAIELDGDTHATTAAKDAARTAFLESRGIRFTNADVMTNVEGVVAEVERVLAENPSPSPSRKREGNTKDLLPPSHLWEGSGEGSAPKTTS